MALFSAGDSRHPLVGLPVVAGSDLDSAFTQCVVVRRKRWTGVSTLPTFRPLLTHGRFGRIVVCSRRYPCVCAELARQSEFLDLHGFRCGLSVAAPAMAIGETAASRCGQLGIIFAIAVVSRGGNWHFGLFGGLAMGVRCGQPSTTVWGLVPLLVGDGRLAMGLSVLGIWGPVVGSVRGPRASAHSIRMALLERLPQYMMGQWFQLPIDGYLLLPRWVQWFVVGLCWVGSFAVIRWLWPLLQARRDARFWAWGMGLSLIPICASFPMDRVLTFTGLGAFALLALKVENWISDGATLAAMEKLMLILHLPVALMALLIRPWIWLGIWAVMTPTGVMDDLAEDDVFIMLHSHELAGAYISIQSLVESDLETPQRLAMLGPGLTHTEVLRLDEQTLEMRPDGGWMPVMASRVTRSTSRPHSVGQVITRPDYQVEILEVTEDGRPLVARFYFQEPLENPRYRWFAYLDGGLTEVRPPAVGQGLSLKSVF